MRNGGFLSQRPSGSTGVPASHQNPQAGSSEKGRCQACCRFWPMQRLFLFKKKKKSSLHKSRLSQPRHHLAITLFLALCLPGPNSLMRLSAGAASIAEGVEPWGLLCLCVICPPTLGCPGKDRAGDPVVALSLRRVEGWGVVPAASQETSWLRVTLPSMPQFHRVAGLLFC